MEMKEFIDIVNKLPLVAKILLCIPCVEIFYGVCRIIQGVNKNDVIWIVLGILTIIPGAFFMWIIDVIWVLLYGHAILLGETLFG
ncbi:MAG: hypothetical protein LUE27_10695 [Clostridia bacterium]|nr:hypothetical protein [Clostridia bacterium]